MLTISPKWSVGTRIGVWCRVKNASQVSSWIPKGKYFIDTKEETQREPKRLIIHGYDAMIKTGADFNADWMADGATELAIVQRIAQAIGVEVDEDTLSVLDSVTLLPKPEDQYSMREMLSYIAVLNTGNFVISNEGKLRLLQFGVLPSDIDVLADENGNEITFGGYDIIV
ncbi:MAG: hypothetical protein HUJ95_02830 [Bacteroidales bacterium]|nr:hypothetical protein [Bacteroidales bacterium]